MFNRLFAEHRLQDLSDLECLPIIDAFDIQVAGVPSPLQQQWLQKQQTARRLELLGRRELTMAAGSWAHVHFDSPEAANTVQRLPSAAATAALAACARFHSATALAEGVAPGKSLLHRQQQRQHPLPLIEDEDARDYIRPMGACELSAAEDADAVATAAPSYAVAATANRLSPKALSPSLSFLKRAVENTKRQNQQQVCPQQLQKCVLLGAPNAVCLFFAIGGEVYMSSLDAVDKASFLTWVPFVSVISTLVFCLLSLPHPLSPACVRVQGCLPFTVHGSVLNLCLLSAIKPSVYAFAHSTC